MTPNSSSFLNFIEHKRNLILAVVGIILATAIFLGLYGAKQDVSLDVLADNSTPLEVALTNNKPTLLEFYANWCTSCQAMAKDLHELKQEFLESSNFVMLNVDNTKWLPEILRYRVDGIPHFVYIDRSGEAIAQSIGEQPYPILKADMEALITQKPLPYANPLDANRLDAKMGKVSSFSNQFQSSKGSDDPRSHGGGDRS